MTTLSLFGTNGNGANGPGFSTGFSGNYIAGTLFKVTSAGYQLTGYGFWRADNSQSASASFALWKATGTGTGTLVASSSASLSSMTAGAWNYVSLGTPIALTSGQVYKVQVGLVNNFPLTGGQFASGGTYAAGITNGVLTAFSDSSGSAPDSFSDVQCSFATSTADPTAAYATSADGGYNAWIDVQITQAGGTSHTATAALTITPVFSAGRTRGKFRTGALTVTPSFSAARARGKYRTGSLTVTPSFSAARLINHGRHASLLVVPSFSAARTAAHVRTASLLVVPSFRAVPSGGATPAVQQGSWWGLVSVLRQSREEFQAYVSRPPMACPNDGEPLTNAPAVPSASGIELFCKYCGFQYPRDWVPPSRPWY